MRDQGIEAKMSELYGADYGPDSPGAREGRASDGGANAAEAINGIIMGELLILLCIAIRYEFKFAVAAVLALVHDVVSSSGSWLCCDVELSSGSWRWCSPW